MVLLCVNWLSAQQTNPLQDSIVSNAENLLENEEASAQWIIDQITPGVKIEGDNMVFSNEALHLIKDESYRNQVYKRPYTFENVKVSLALLDLQKGFWQMMNIYPENKDLVLRFIYAYDQIIPADKILLASFYTYAYLDPEITTLENNKPNVMRPDLLEAQFKKAQEIVKYIEYLRKEAEKTTAK
jgi:hypothetical protein